MVRKVSVLCMFALFVSSAAFAQQRGRQNSGGVRSQPQAQARSAPRTYAQPTRGYGAVRFAPMPRLRYYPRLYSGLAFGRSYSWLSYLAFAAAMGVMVPLTACVEGQWYNGWDGPVWVQGYCPSRPAAVVIYPRYPW